MTLARATDRVRDHAPPAPAGDGDQHAQPKRITGKASAKRRKRRKQRLPDPVYYVVEILGWDWSLMFGVSNTPHISNGPYDDYRHLKIQGRLIRPTRLQAKEVELTFLPDERLNQEHRQHDRPTNIGRLSFHGYPRGLLSLPADALCLLLSMLIGEKFKFVVIHGSTLRYRQADLKSFRFEMQIDDEDLPDG